MTIEACCEVSWVTSDLIFGTSDGKNSGETLLEGFFGGVAKGSSVPWVAKLKGDKHSACKLSNGWSQSYREIHLLLSTEK